MQRSVLWVGSGDEDFPISNKIAIQIHIIGIYAAVVLHPPRIDGMYKQQSGVLRIQPGKIFFDEELHHRRANNTLCAVFASGQNDQFLGLGQGFGAQPIQGQFGVFSQSVLMQFGIRPVFLHMSDLAAKAFT